MVHTASRCSPGDHERHQVELYNKCSNTWTYARNNSRKNKRRDMGVYGRAGTASESLDLEGQQACFIYTADVSITQRQCFGRFLTTVKLIGNSSHVKKELFCT